jgi:peptidoglycan/xylan/chitin deacetylase (PgdA/CDA1 family)
MAGFLPILTFHAIDDESSVIAFPAALCRAAMAMLFDAGYRALTLLDVVQCVNEKKFFPDRSFAITFDDGYRSFYEQAFANL